MSSATAEAPAAGGSCTSGSSYCEGSARSLSRESSLLVAPVSPCARMTVKLYVVGACPPLAAVIGNEKLLRPWESAGLDVKSWSMLFKARVGLIVALVSAVYSCARIKDKADETHEGRKRQPSRGPCLCCAAHRCYSSQAARLRTAPFGQAQVGAS